MEDDQNGRRAKWKTTNIEDDQNGDDQSRRQTNWKTTADTCCVLVINFSLYIVNK